MSKIVITTVITQMMTVKYIKLLDKVLCHHKKRGGGGKVFGLLSLYGEKLMTGPSKAHG
jgi:hypothetical protein